LAAGRHTFPHTAAASNRRKAFPFNVHNWLLTSGDRKRGSTASFDTRSAGKALARYQDGPLLGRLASTSAAFSALGLVPWLVRAPTERVVIEISIQCVSERLLGLRRVGMEKSDLNEEGDFGFAQFDRRAAKAAFSTVEGPARALR